jgi:aspartate ammonia-lyase
MNEQGYRIEHDMIGPTKVPCEALFGGQTQRAVDLYPLMGEKPLSAYPELIAAILQIKKAAVIANLDSGDLPENIGRAILGAVESLLENAPADQFPVHAFHGGGGVSTNMNVNEVIANMANRDAFRMPLGMYDPVHPNDHVNLNQSTNDVLTTACHLAVISKWRALEAALSDLGSAFARQGRKWEHVERIARTCLQDAVEITYKDFFSGYEALIRRHIRRLNASIKELRTVNLGGNIVGRRGDTSDAYFGAVMGVLNRVLGGDSLIRSDCLFDCSQNHDDLVCVASQLELLARGLVKIAKDFRLMASGPQTGFGEISLPAVQPGSSALPGKINPTIPEFLVQCGFYAVGRSHSAIMTIDHGELDLNVWESTVINNVLDSMSCLENGVRVFTTRCLSGVDVHLKRNEENVNTLIPLLIRIKKVKGYSFACRAAKETGGNLEALKKILQDSSV